MSTAQQKSTAAPRSGLRGLLRRFLRNPGGATPVEFAILALPFSLMLFAILESCISFAGQQVLSNAADDVSRQLRTGQIKAVDMTEAKFRQMMCDRIKIFVTADCTNTSLLLDLREYPTFEEAAKIKIKYTSDKDIDTTGFNVKPGASGSINMMRVFYKWPVMTDLMRLAVSNLKDGKTLHFAAVVWQNEPFND